MKDQFATFEIALELKKLGFNEACIMIELIREDKPYSPSNSGIIQKPMTNTDCGQYSVAIPLWQQAEDWFRDKHHLDIIVSSNTIGYGFIIYHRYPPKNTLDTRVFQTHKEARKEAILKALELIQ